MNVCIATGGASEGTDIVNTALNITSDAEKRVAPPIAWVEICKGLGIYLVVLGHANINLMLHECIYLFHMPLFFFLSGYLHTPKSDLTGYCKKKTIHLLVPYVSFLLLLYPLELVRVALHHHGAGHDLWPALGHSLFAAVWGGDRLQGMYGVFWFLPCLFMTQQLVNALMVGCRRGVTIAVVVLALLLSYANAWFAPHFRLPLDANVVLAAMPFFLLGFLIKGVELNRLILVLCSLGAVAGAYLVSLSLPVLYDMRSGVYGVPGVSLIIATCCIVCLIGVSRLCTRVGYLKSTLTSLGGASMGIMFIHKQIPAISAIDRWAIAHGYTSSVLFLVMSFLITQLLQRTLWTRALLLGSERDFRRVFRLRNGAAGSVQAGDDKAIHVRDAFGKLHRAS